MRNRITETLARLASLPFQRALVVRGTAERYALPRELVDEAANVLEVTLTHPVLARALTREEVESLEEMATVLERRTRKVPFDDGTLSNEALVEGNPDWAAVRDQARATLVRLGFDLEEWEAHALGEGPL